MSTAPIILIADRNDDALKYLQEELATADYTLLHAKDGREALSLVETQPSPIAFAVVELELPGVNGLHLIGRLTSQEPKPKIIATTFLEDEVLFELATHMGADVVIKKPCPWKMAPLFGPATPKQVFSAPQTTPLREILQELQ
jgi:DNA-binding response OmpR family regulator